MKVLRLWTMIFFTPLLVNCVGFVIDTAVDTTIAVAKVPFKVAGAVVDVVVPDGDDEDK